MIVVTAGHVDHGKSSLIKALTGTDTDTLELEKKRGLSIDLGFAYYHFNAESQEESPYNAVISFVDVPGHTDFINNMLAGVSGASAALVAISAFEGVKPQTREHLLILDLLGIDKGLVALTFADSVTPERLSEVKQQTIELLNGTSLAHCPILAVSNISGSGIPATLDYLKTLWRNTPAVATPNSAYVRYCIDRSFTLKGVGTVLTGTILTGSLNQDTQLVHANSRKRVRLKSLYLDKEPVTHSQQGDRVALGVNLNQDQISRGDWLVSPSLAFATHIFDARLRLAPQIHTEQLNKLRSKASLHLYIGSAHSLAQLRLLKEDDNGTIVQIRSRKELFTNFGDRLILRDAANQCTLAGGYVLDLFSPRRKPNSPSHLAMLAAQDRPIQEAIEQLIEISEYGLSLERFSLTRNIRPPEVIKLLTLAQDKQVAFETFQLPSASSIGVPLPTALSIAWYRRHCDAIRNALCSLHEQNPQRVGINEMALMIAIKFSGNPALFSAICERMSEQELIVRTGPLLHLPNHQVPKDEQALILMQQIRPHLAKAKFVAPRVVELMEVTGLPRSTIERLLRTNVNTGNLIQLSRNRFYLPETIKAMHALIESLLLERAHTGLSVIEFRNLTGIGRNLCIEILEFFDQQGLTLRRNNVRYLRTAAL